MGEAGWVGLMSACPKCGNKSSEVTHNKHQDDGSIQRRRKCGLCGFRFNTVEMLQERLSPMQNLLDAIRSIQLGHR